jgi:biotin synthase
MSDEMQALCFMAGANSIFYGEKLLTTGNPDVERDRQLFARLGLKPEQRPVEFDERANAAPGETFAGVHRASPPS